MSSQEYKPPDPKAPLAQIAKELASLADQEPEGKYVPYTSSRGEERASLRKEFFARQRFGEIIAVLLEEKSIRAACVRLHMNSWTLRRYYLRNKEFCDLLRKANEELFLSYVSQIQESQANVVARREELAEAALDEMERLLHESDSEHVRFKVSQDLLDRDPRWSRTKRIEGTGVPVVVNFQTVQLAAQAAREIDTPKSEGHLIDLPKESEG